MAHVLVIEFTAPNALNLYHEVNDSLGIETSWPAGMLSHLAGESGDKLFVVEVWETREAQAEFMQTRLGPALHAVGAPDPSRVEWFAHAGDMHTH